MEKAEIEKIHRDVRKASNRKILRRQLELLTEYSRTTGQEKIPECCEAAVHVHSELVKAEGILLVRFLIVFFGVLYLVKRVAVKGVEFVKG